MWRFTKKHFRYVLLDPDFSEFYGFYPRQCNLGDFKERKGKAKSWYLDFEDEVVASERESDDPERVEQLENRGDLRAMLDGVVRHVGHPSLDDRGDPHYRAVADGGDGPDEGHAGDGVEVGQLGQQDGSAREHEVPLHRGEVVRAARVAAQELEEHLAGRPADDDQGHAGASREVHDGEQRQPVR